MCSLILKSPLFMSVNKSNYFALDMHGLISELYTPF